MLTMKDANRELSSARRYYSKCKRVVQQFKDDNAAPELVKHWEAVTKTAKAAIATAQAMVERVGAYNE